MYLKKSSLNWALVHIERFGDTDIFPMPFEFQAVRAAWSSILPQLESLDVSRHQVGDFRRALTPKSRYGFRTATQLHPIDAIIFSALVYELAKDLEAERLPKAADRVASHRVSRGADGQLYDNNWNFERFKEILRRKCGEMPQGWVVVTDIADFYPRIYHHPLANALNAATTKVEHVDAIMGLLGQWNFRVSYGVPVGPAATRLLAELAINDVDHALLDEGLDFCRFSDDFRIFTRTEREAFRALSLLAEYLHENHGLSLSERKTDIIPVERFVARFLEGDRPGDSAHLSDRVGQILERHGREEDKYAALDVDELPADLVRELDELDLNSVITEQLSDHRLFDNFAVSIALRRLAQLEDPTVLDVVIDNLDYLTPVLPQVVNFLKRVTSPEKKPEVGRRLAEAIATGLSSHREYQSAWLLSLFTENAGWNSRDQLVALLGETTDDVARPMLLQALGVAGNRPWFQKNRRQIQSLGGWQRRSFMRGAQCMTRDEYTHWMKSLMPRLDLLDKAVASFCLRDQQ
jgi:Reverse transcriptase (RNA-dependent DNA polymerase)